MAWTDPATGRQLRQIALYADRLGIKEPIEDRGLTRGEARELLYRLRLAEKGGNR